MPLGAVPGLRAWWRTQGPCTVGTVATAVTPAPSAARSRKDAPRRSFGARGGLRLPERGLGAPGRAVGWRGDSGAGVGAQVRRPQRPLAGRGAVGQYLPVASHADPGGAGPGRVAAPLLHDAPLLDAGLRPGRGRRAGAVGRHLGRHLALPVGGRQAGGRAADGAGRPSCWGPARPGRSTTAPTPACTRSWPWRRSFGTSPSAGPWSCPSRGRLLCVLGLTAALMYTHYWDLYLVGVGAVWALWRSWSRPAGVWWRPAPIPGRPARCCWPWWPAASCGCRGRPCSFFRPCTRARPGRRPPGLPDLLSVFGYFAGTGGAWAELLTFMLFALVGLALLARPGRADQRRAGNEGAAPGGAVGVAGHRDPGRGRGRSGW